MSCGKKAISKRAHLFRGLVVEKQHSDDEQWWGPTAHLPHYGQWATWGPCRTVRPLCVRLIWLDKGHVGSVRLLFVSVWAKLSYVPLQSHFKAPNYQFGLSAIGPIRVVRRVNGLINKQFKLGCLNAFKKKATTQDSMVIIISTKEVVFSDIHYSLASKITLKGIKDQFFTLFYCSKNRIKNK